MNYSSAPEERAPVVWWLFLLVVTVVIIFYTTAFLATPQPAGLHFAAGRFGWRVQVDDYPASLTAWQRVNTAAAQEGDLVLQIGDVPYGARQRHLPLYQGYSLGDQIPLALLRDGQLLRVSVVASPTPPTAQLVWYPPLPFWLAAVLLLWRLRPIDRAWRRLFLYLSGSAVWMTLLVVSPLQIAWSSLWLRVLTWLLLALAADLFYAAPQPVGRPFSQTTLTALYGAAGILGLLELRQALPPSFFLVGAVSHLLAIAALLLWRLRRRQTILVSRVLLLSLLASVTPGVALLAAMSLIALPAPVRATFAAVALVALPTWPITCLYALYRPGFDRAEPLLRRLLNYAIFFNLSFGLSAAILVAYGYRRDAVLLWGIILALGLAGFGRFKRWLGRSDMNGVSSQATLALAQRASDATRESLPRLICDVGRSMLLLRETAVYLPGEGWQTGRQRATPVILPKTIKR